MSNEIIALGRLIVVRAKQDIESLMGGGVPLPGHMVGVSGRYSAGMNQIPS